MRDIARFSLVLLLICVISAGMLAVIHSIAEPRIIQQRKIEEENAIKEVLPKEPEVIEKIEEQDLVYYKALDGKGNIIAYVFIAQARGYSSNIRTVVSFKKPGGQIIAVKVLEQQETPGVGTRITTEEFLSQFRDRNINQKFDTITGATISSSAVIDSIKQKAQEIMAQDF